MKSFSGWEKVKLKDVCTVKSGGTPSTSIKEYWDNGTIPWLGSNACKDSHIYKSEKFITEEGLNNSSAKIFEKGTVLVALVGATIGKTGFLDIKATTNQNIAGIFPKDNQKIIPEYLFYAIRNLYPKFISLSNSSFKMANLKFIKNLEILLPQIETQEEIADTLKKVEKIKDFRKESDELTNHFLKSVFFNMFGDLVKNPMNWTVQKLGQLCSFENGDRGKNYPSNHTKNRDGIPFINAGCLLDEGLDESKFNFITKDQFHRLGSGKFKKGDFIFCLRGSIGKFGYNNFVSTGAIASSLVIIRPNSQLIPEYLNYYFQSNLCKIQILKANTSSSQPNLSAGNLKLFNIPLPPIELQKKFALIVKEVKKAKEKQKNSEKKINDLFNLLIRESFRGELNC